MALGVIVIGLFYLASGVGYGAIVDRLHADGPPAGTTLSIWARSLLGRYVPGKFLMVVSRVVMSYDHGVPRRVTVAATVYEQLLTLGVAAAGSVLFVILFGTAGAVQVWLLALLPLGLVVLHPRIFGPTSAWLLRKARREPLPVLLTARPLAALIAWYAAHRLPALHGRLAAGALGRRPRGRQPGLRGPGLPGLVRDLGPGVPVPLRASGCGRAPSRSRWPRTSPRGWRWPSRWARASS